MGLQGVELIMLGYNTPTFNIYHPEPLAPADVSTNRLSVQAGAYQKQQLGGVDRQGGRKRMATA